MKRPLARAFSASAPRRRALMYVPGSEERFLKKATTLNADTICIDLEDAISTDKKEIARKTVCLALHNLEFNSEVCVRINPIGSDLGKADLSAILKNGKLPNAILLPKVEYPQDVQTVCNALGSNDVQLIALVESPRAILDLQSICNASSRLTACVFGADDYVASVGGERTKSNHEVSFPRGYFLMQCQASDKQAIDMVTIDYKDNAQELQQESRIAFQMGFEGKQIIHPSQIDPVQSGFTPSGEAIAWATELISEFERQSSLGKGAFEIRGQMIDAPTIKQAQRILAKAT